MNMSALDDIAEVISRARVVAMEYYRLTGKPLGITGEIGEYEATRILGLKLSRAREAGFDATDSVGRRFQVKARCVARAGLSSGQRLGSIKLRHSWDAVLLLLMDEQFMPTAIREADRVCSRQVAKQGTSAPR
jgi:hypothetical protein